LSFSQEIYINKGLEAWKIFDECDSYCEGDRLKLSLCPKNDLERKCTKNISHASIVGSLMFVQVCTKLNITFAIAVLGRYQSYLGIHHWKVAKNVIKYL